MEGLQLNDDLLWLLVRFIAPPATATPPDVEVLGRCCMMSKKFATEAEERVWKLQVLAFYDPATLEANKSAHFIIRAHSYRDLYLRRCATLLLAFS